MILEKPKLLFIHIPRTGGSSIENFFNFCPCAPMNKKESQYSTLEESKEYCKIENYFKFTIVRNPWDRLLSWFLWSYAEVIYYQYISERGEHPQDGKKGRARAWAKGRKLLNDKKNRFVDQKLFLKFKTSFSSFIERLEGQSNLNADPRYDSIGALENRLYGRWIMPQSMWIESSGKIEMDYICKFEKLKIDFNIILRKRGIEAKPLEQTGKIYHKPDYRKFYTKRNQEIINRLYEEDIKRFKYDF